MINSFWIFLLRMNSKQVSEGNYFLALAEFIATIVVVAIFRNT